MKIVVNLLALLFIPVFLFTGFALAKSNNDPIHPEPDSWPFLVEEVLANGEVILHNGSSSESDLRKIAIDLSTNPYPEDKISSFPKLDLNMGGKITLHRAPTYTVVDGKKSSEYRSWTTNVGELLSEKGVAVGEEDKINFSVDEELILNMEIKIIRVARTRLVEKETISYKVIEKEDPNLERGKTRIEQSGESGTRELVYEVIREDGEEISRTLVSNEISKKPIDTIKYFGTKVIVLSSEKGYATLTNMYPSGVVSASYRCGTLIRITNLSNGVSIERRVTHTWGSASAPYGVVLDVGANIWASLGYAEWGRGPLVLIEEIKE